MTNLSQPSLRDRLEHAPVDDRETSDEAHTSHELTEDVARGKSASTPFVLLGGVALTVWAFVALVTVAALLVWWLV